MYPGYGFRTYEIGDVDVIKYDGLYHLFHLTLPNHDYIAHAVSEDALRWRRVQNALFISDPKAWDDDMLLTIDRQLSTQVVGQTSIRCLECFVQKTNNFSLYWLIINEMKQAVETFRGNHIIREFRVTITQIDPPTNMKINRTEKTRVIRFQRCFEERSKCKKKWRCTNICKIAAINRPDRAVGLEIPWTDASPKETRVNTTARANPTRYFLELRWPIPKASFIAF